MCSQRNASRKRFALRSLLDPSSHSRLMRFRRNLSTTQRVYSFVRPVELVEPGRSYLCVSAHAFVRERQALV